MSEPELEFEIDEFGCIRCRVTNEGALLSKDEKEFIIDYVTRMQTENAKLRELVRGLHMAYIETLNECESVNEGLIWEYSGSIEDDVAKSRAKFKADRHRFDAALRELGVEK